MFRARRMLIGLAAAAVLALLTACAVLRQPQFGADPEGERLERTRRSPHYVDGEFRSLVATRTLAEGQSTLAITVSDALNPASNLRPTQPVPTTRTDLKALDASRDTVVALQRKVGEALVPLGVGAYLERWGYAPAQIHEADWYGQLELDAGVRVHLVPARHCSGRLLTRNKTLWTGFVLESSTRRILFSGDSDYGPHLKEIPEHFGGFDLVALDMGQYDPRWPDIHTTPEQAAQAAEDLMKARALVPAHVGRFSIARHAELKRQPGRATGHAPTEAKRARSLAI